MPSSSSPRSPLPMLPSRPVLLLPPPSSRFGPPTPVRPVDLPNDVLLSIFERLSHVRDIAAVRGVCLAWRTLVDHTETIWRSLVFDLPRCARTAHHAETWYRKAADYGNSQAQVGTRHTFTKGERSNVQDCAVSLTLNNWRACVLSTICTRFAAPVATCYSSCWRCSTLTATAAISANSPSVTCCSARNTSVFL